MKIALLLSALLFSGCVESRLTGYNLKASVGQTAEEGSRSIYTGAAVDAHFEVRP